MTLKTLTQKHFYVFLIPAVVLLLFCLSSIHAHAGVVQPSGEKYGDDYAIEEELRENGTATLVKGKTYYISSWMSLDSNQTLNATGATLVCDGACTRTFGYKTGYNSAKNVKIIGGKWISTIKGGYTQTSFSFSHANNITLKNMEILCTNAEGHAIEFVSCKDCIVSGCRIIAQGKSKKNSVEEMVQIDLATPRTAPFLTKKYQNGLACKNISIIGNTITGNRAVCTNYAASEKKYKKKYHSNIVIKNNVLTGKTSEALAMFNTISATVSGNTIKTKSSRTGTAYSIGCHFALFGNIKKASSGKIVVKNNKIYGGRQAFQIYSHTGSRYGSLKLTGNKLYCKKGAGNAIKIGGVKKVKQSKNKTKKWK